MTTTTKNGFNTVSQSGSGVAWTGLSNMPYPTEGEAAAALTAGSQVANTINLIVPYESAGIPTGSTFDSMVLYITVKKTGTFSSGTSVTWSGDTNYSTSGVWSFTQTTDESYQNLTLSGDASYWRISGIAAASIITLLKSGSMYFRVDGETNSAIACGLRITSATCTITYTTVEGKRGAIIATLL